MDLNELKEKINTFLLNFQGQVKKIFEFVVWRLKNYAQMTVAEQVAYPCVLLGVTLIFTSFILMLL